MPEAHNACNTLDEQEVKDSPGDSMYHSKEQISVKIEANVNLEWISLSFVLVYRCRPLKDILFTHNLCATSTDG